MFPPTSLHIVFTENVIDIKVSSECFSRLLANSPTWSKVEAMDN